MIVDAGAYQPAPPIPIAVETSWRRSWRRAGAERGGKRVWHWSARRRGYECARAYGDVVERVRRGLA